MKGTIKCHGFAEFKKKKHKKPIYALSIVEKLREGPMVNKLVVIGLIICQNRFVHLLLFAGVA